MFFFCLFLCIFLDVSTVNNFSFRTIFESIVDLYIYTRDFWSNFIDRTFDIIIKFLWNIISMKRRQYSKCHRIFWRLKKWKLFEVCKEVLLSNFIWKNFYWFFEMRKCKYHVKFVSKKSSKSKEKNLLTGVIVYYRESEKLSIAYLYNALKKASPI